MKKMPAAADPDACVAALDGWRRDLVTELRAAVRGAAKFEEVVRWGHLVYFANGPVLLIRAEERRVLFGFWRGQELRAIEPRLKPGGKYEMATVELGEGDTVTATTARRLAREASALNEQWGEPQLAVKPAPRATGASNPAKWVRGPKPTKPSRKACSSHRSRLRALLRSRACVACLPSSPASHERPPSLPEVLLRVHLPRPRPLHLPRMRP